MNDVTTLAIAAGVTLPASALLAYGALRFAARRNMLDVPGARSLHDAPTPRGGGIAIVLCVLAAAAWSTMIGDLPAGTGAALVAGGAIVATLGWIDDRRGLPAAVRGAGYLAAACLGAWLAGGLPRVTLGPVVLHTGFAGLPLAALGIAWLTNLYNFMDGADGIAAGQGISAGIFGAVLFALGGDTGAALVCVVIAASCAGFLLFNFPPARLFMGDTGSCLLGFVFGVLALHGELTGSVPLCAWLILLLWFVMDASLTLARRMVRGEKWYSPHRTHAYQLLVQSGLGHRGLLLRFLLINGFLLGPLALVAVRCGVPAQAAAVSIIIAIPCWFHVQRRHGMFNRREA